MTLSEMEALRAQYKTAFDVMLDRLHEMPVYLLIEMLLERTPAADLEAILMRIQVDVDESINEEKINGSYH